MFQRLRKEGAVPSKRREEHMGYKITAPDGRSFFETDNPLSASRFLLRSRRKLDGTRIVCRTEYLRTLLQKTVSLNKGEILSAAVKEGYKEISRDLAAEIVSSAIAA